MKCTTPEEASAAYAADLAAHPLDTLPYLFSLADGFTGKITKNFTGTYCGYVYHTDYLINITDYDVHGGITYDTDHMVGFDYNHSRDYNTLFTASEYEHGIYVWLFEDVKREVQLLHAQIVDALLPPQVHRNNIAFQN